MGLKGLMLGAVAACAMAAPGAFAQDRAQTLADVRQELTVLNVELMQLRTELNTTGAPQGVASGPLRDRVSAIEAALTRLTNKTEELEFKVNSVATDGANRMDDLSFRLCELETDCNVMNEGMSKPLGGVESAAVGGSMTGPAGSSVPETTGTQLAVGEQADYDAAVAALNAGDFAGAADRLASFIEMYPGTPLTGQAHFMRGEALAAQSMIADAARAYLASFSADQTGASAPDALLQLGSSLGELGQVTEACATLAEVPNRFPGSPQATEAQNERMVLSCQ